MWNDLTYHLIISILEAFMWDGELIGGEKLQEGPDVIVANHMGAIGPVGICASIPMRQPFFPVVIREAGLVMGGKPVVYNSLNEIRAERRRMVSLLEAAVKTMHLEATENQEVQPIIFKRRTS